MAVSLRPSRANPPEVQSGWTGPAEVSLRALPKRAARSRVGVGIRLSVREFSDKFVPMHRLRPYHLALCVLLVGWTPSFLLAYYSYTVLGRAVESKIVADDRDLVGSLSQHVENELERTGETLDYYQTLPATVSLLQSAVAPVAVPVAPAVPAIPAPPAARRRAVATPLPSPAATPAPTASELLATIFYPQRRIDGLFLTDASGHLLAALPPDSPDESVRTFGSPWKEAAEQSRAPFYVSPAYPRAADGRLVTSVVVTVRGKDGNLLGFLGADILIERLGKRLRAVQMDAGSQTMIQIVDGSGRMLFGEDYQLLPAAAGHDISPGVRRAIQTRRNGGKKDVKEEDGQLYFFTTIEPTNWTIMLERPAALGSPARAGPPAADGAQRGSAGARRGGTGGAHLLDLPPPAPGQPAHGARAGLQREDPRQHARGHRARRAGRRGVHPGQQRLHGDCPLPGPPAARGVRGPGHLRPGGHRQPRGPGARAALRRAFPGHRAARADGRRSRCAS